MGLLKTAFCNFCWVTADVGLLYSCLQVGHGHWCLIWLLILSFSLYFNCQFAMTLSKYWGIIPHLIIGKGGDPTVHPKFPHMIWRMASDVVKNKALQQNCIYRAWTTFSQSLMATDDALKLDYSLILEFKSMKPNLILSSQLLPAICKVSGSSYFTKTTAQRMRSTLVYSIAFHKVL